MPSLPTGDGEVLRFGTAAVTEPFAYHDANRAIVGFDVELATRVASRLGRRLEIVDMEFGAMIPALLGGKVDMIGACITITPERAKSVLFSNSYYTGGISALVRAPAP
jgi:polar amino acid transport system substrate-binding protein